jgi:predicted transcriptional regulator of viral defense system
MREYRAGLDLETLKARTGFEDKKLRNIVFRLSKKGQIERTGPGVYKAKA